MKQGFSLLELLVVMMIIALGYSFVGPRIIGPMSNLNLKTASKKISASLRYARSRATSENRNFRVLFDFDKNRIVITGRELTENNTEITSEENTEGNSGDKIYSLPDGVILEKAISDDSETVSGIFEVAFFSTGGSSGGEIILKNDKENRYRISVGFITGTIHLVEVEE
ncbi:MAG TPA: GspH/FimT family pseudopilin [Desulfobacteraceae bacterium]|nr:GspH/FimT family pseudopilin [Desulfobacteraceae bacterium]HPJ67733.1 GspH/FimT family pseudopilin [Desulfobacteraceae bacterium]HPQ28117.1 GspH/FimT family pseudopilin [Desulfobacteraceae bacterium]